MGLVVTPEGSITIDEELAAEMALTGYVASVNGMQGAIDLDLSGISPPGGTAPGSVYTINGAHAAEWLARDTFLSDLFDGRAWFLDAASIDGTADDVQINAAITACAAAAGGTVSVAGFPALSTAGKIVPKAGVTIYGGRQHSTLAGGTGMTIAASSSFTDPWMVDAGVALDGWAVVGLNLVGRGAISTPLGGIRVYSGTHNALIRFCTIGGMSDSCVLLDDSSVGCTVDHNVMQYLVTGRTLTAPLGVLHVLGSDHDIGLNEINAGPSHTGGPSNGYDRVSYPGQFYRCAVYVGGHNIDFSGVVPEFGDTGWYIDSTANLNRFSHCRSDYSAGPGAYVLGSFNIFEAFQVNGNGFADTYDGLYYDAVMHDGSAASNIWTDYQLDNGGAPNACRYGWADYVTGNGTKNENRLVSFMIRPEDCVYDTVYRAEPRTSVSRGGSGPASDRPPSRHANGEWWTDTDRGTPTYSDDAGWRDLVGDVVGNLATPKLAEGIGGTMQIQGDPISGTCTLAGVVWANASTTGRKLETGVVAVAACTPAGVTAGYMDVVVVGDDAGHLTDVGAATTLTVVVRTIAATAGRTVKLVMNWFSAAGSYDHTDAAMTATLHGANSTSDVTDHVFRGITVPAGLRPGPVFRILAAANGEQHWINCVGIYNDPAGLVTGYSAP